MHLSLLNHTSYLGQSTYLNTFMINLYFDDDKKQSVDFTQQLVPMAEELAYLINKIPSSFHY